MIDNETTSKTDALPVSGISSDCPSEILPGEEPVHELPQWEAAFAEYARNSAPDLLPELLRKTGSAGKHTRTHRRYLIYRIAGVAAAVILVGILVLTLSPLRNHRSAKYATSQTVEPTLTDISDSMSSELHSERSITQYSLNASKDTSSLLSIWGFSNPAEANDARQNASYAQLDKEYKADSSQLLLLCRNVIIGDPVQIKGLTLYQIVVDGKPHSKYLLWMEDAISGTRYDILLLHAVTPSADLISEIGYDFQICLPVMPLESSDEP